jgi:preprotein translocase subunit YajC
MAATVTKVTTETKVTMVTDVNVEITVRKVRSGQAS